MINDALHDSDESDLENLLDQIDSIQAPTLKATQKPTKTTKPPAQGQHTLLIEAQMAPSSDLFDAMEGFDAMEEASALAIERPALQVPSAQAIAPLPPFQPTIQTNDRPHIGISSLSQPHTGNLRRPPPPDATVSTSVSLAYPVSPDSFTHEIFLNNIRAMDIENAHQRVPISSIPAMDKFTKVPLAVGMITKVDQPIGRDFLVRLSDDTGSYDATIHEQVFREARMRPHYGMLLVISDCTIFRPAVKTQCLIVVSRNVKQMIPNIIRI